ncbi:MAG: beta-CASP ribonuclease aCPSF1 [Candidatus Aenigmatarchaeota archaeon]|nr:MAG: beta-CASP ribonuclease aCPSF1 [Candidatus Aenigmarchaeota archaeon]
MNILKELQDKLPSHAMISEVKFEGSEIVIYTKSKDFFVDNERSVRELVRGLKKRIEVRPDLTITADMETTKKRIGEIVPKDAGIKAVYFEPEMGKVVIEAQKPGLVIGKGGETFRSIKRETFWLPKIERAPAIDSDVVRAVRNFLHSEIDYRKRFLNSVGNRINTPIETDSKKEEWVRLTALGGFRQVGRSCILVQTPHSNVLLDCGIDPGSDNVPLVDLPEFSIDRLDAVVASHAHLDHVGFIPYLYKEGFKGPLYCTAPTRDLMVLLCMDYIDVCQSNGKQLYYNKKDIEKAVKHSIVLDYGEVSDITPNIRLTLQPSGHLLGSSLIHLHIGNGLHNILYTGDLKFGPSKLFEPAYTNFQRVETLITESTYGAAEDVTPHRNETEDAFFRIINDTISKGGKVLIPSFAVGRAQELMVLLASRPFEHPVYMEGMLWDATAIHTAYPEYLSKYLQRSIFKYGKNPFVSKIFKRVAPKERDSIIDSKEPAVIIATSGMLIGGPAVEYLKGLAPDAKNTLMFVGYQAEGTLGRRIQKGWKDIPMADASGRTKTMPIKMNVETIHGLTGHSTRPELINYVKRLGSKPERILVDHGENRKCIELSRDLHRICRCETLAPKNMETIRLK